MSSRTVAALVMFVVLATATTCVPRPRSSVALFEQQLRPVLVLDRSTGGVGDMIEGTYTVKNAGPRVVAACFGEANGYNIFGSAAAKGRVASVDHSTCDSRFRLEPGQEARTRIVLEILDVGVGPASVNAWVEVVDPTHCDEYGCDRIKLATKLEPLLTILGQDR
jgi:hypothetical protein